MMITPAEARMMLGVEQEATFASCKTVYKKLAIMHHPDKNGNSEESTLKFKHLSSAYKVLEMESRGELQRYDPCSEDDASSFNMEEFRRIFEAICRNCGGLGLFQTEENGSFSDHGGDCYEFEDFDDINGNDRKDSKLNNEGEDTLSRHWCSNCQAFHDINDEEEEHEGKDGELCQCLYCKKKRKLHDRMKSRQQERVFLSFEHNIHPVAVAIRIDDAKTIKELLVNVKLKAVSDCDDLGLGNTPLHYVAKYEASQCVHVLMKAPNLPLIGAWLSFRNEYGQIPLDLCWPKSKIAKELLKLGDLMATSAESHANALLEELAEEATREEKKMQQKSKKSGKKKKGGKKPVAALTENITSSAPKALRCTENATSSDSKPKKKVTVQKSMSVNSTTVSSNESDDDVSGYSGAFSVMNLVTESGEINETKMKRQQAKQAAADAKAALKKQEEEASAQLLKREALAQKKRMTLARRQEEKAAAESAMLLRILRESEDSEAPRERLIDEQTLLDEGRVAEITARHTASQEADMDAHQIRKAKSLSMVIERFKQQENMSPLNSDVPVISSSEKSTGVDNSVPAEMENISTPVKQQSPTTSPVSISPFSFACTDSSDTFGLDNLRSTSSGSKTRWNQTAVGAPATRPADDLRFNGNFNPGTLFGPGTDIFRPFNSIVGGSGKDSGLASSPFYIDSLTPFSSSPAPITTPPIEPLPVQDNQQTFLHAQAQKPRLQSSYVRSNHEPHEQHHHMDMLPNSFSRPSGISAPAPNLGSAAIQRIDHCSDGGRDSARLNVFSHQQQQQSHTDPRLSQQRPFVHQQSAFRPPGLTQSSVVDGGFMGHNSFGWPVQQPNNCNNDIRGNQYLLQQQQQSLQAQQWQNYFSSEPPFQQ